MILAVMSNKSPIIIISSLGAVAAVLMIVFQHTLCCRWWRTFSCRPTTCSGWGLD
ncbi:hypothetical protein LNQ52_00595 [Klebsiella pneumoniae subsp. pneumoniae]|nr:hypothetical protein [Klebsiella pneumoniae subsp. pneumoniae]